MVEVGSVNEAVRKAKELGLGSFEIAEWRYEKEAWVELGFWAKGKDGIRHNMAWANANISSTLDRADSAIREMLVARTKVDVLAAATTTEVK